MAKALSPLGHYFVRVMGGEDVGVGRVKSADEGVAVQEIRQVRGCEVVEGLVCGKEYLEVYALFYRKPVKLTDDRGDVLTGEGTGEQQSFEHIVVFEEQWRGDHAGCHCSSRAWR